MSMDIAIIGLGRMGLNIAKRLLKQGFRVVAFDVDDAPILAAEKAGAVGARTIDEVIKKLKRPRAVWVMVPAGEITEATVHELGRRLAPGDILLDGGNSNYKE